jgi:hypothetical protein
MDSLTTAIRKLEALLKAGGLTARQEQEVRVELEMLRKEQEKQKPLPRGVSNYGSYFS